ncbi:acyl-CoA carboxylase subunit epsilon [Streptomyces sp. B21-083]|uniref:acyl-CoA carboxylase subunit epsilon n=1 Tax=Streptomyces sp. B21-083 TaxID=3039410 RepID=UPI002FF01642
MTTSTADPSLVRVTRGRVTPEEMAALVTVLFARPDAATPPGTGRHHRAATWRRPERAPGHRGPRSWRGETRPGVREAT